jgi:two-component system sensor histidine kinase RegB
VDPQLINLSWLLTLRWGAIVGQLATILLVHFGMGIRLPLVPLALIVAIEVATNGACRMWLRRARTVREWMLGVLMAFDFLILTGLLYYAGGPYNPFSFLYLVNIALAAVVLSPAWTWALVLLALASFGTLFFAHAPLPGGPGAHAGHEEHLRMHLEGMWVAFGVAAAFIVYFVQRVTRALSAREAELATARSLSARSEKLASLATLAAGAAHQLATPLSTIAVAAKELEHGLARIPPAPAGGTESSVAPIEDARLIREQVERCREILLQMAADAGESTGEPIVAVRIDDLVTTALAGIPGADQGRVVVDNHADGRAIRTTVRSVAQALRAVLKNALEATPSQVTLRVTADDQACRLEVRDSGSGMAAEVLRHAGEPFFTTKGPDRGMGLGLFLTRIIIERLGGRFELDSRPNHGTTAVLIVPLGLAVP